MQWSLVQCLDIQQLQYKVAFILFSYLLGYHQLVEQNSLKLRWKNMEQSLYLSIYLFILFVTFTKKIKHDKSPSVAWLRGVAKNG